MGISIKLTKGGKAYAPGEAIEGDILVPDIDTGTPVKMELVWRTEGKGTEDSKVMEQLVFETDNLSDSKIPFSFNAPQGPLSCIGKFIRVHWEITALLKRPLQKASLPIVISHTGEPIMLK